MAYRTPALFFFHSLREAVSVIDPNINNIEAAYDSRTGEQALWKTPMSGGSKVVTITRPDVAPNDDLDTIIITGHNFNGIQIGSRGSPSADVLLAPTNVTENNGEPILNTNLVSKDVSVEPAYTFDLTIGGGSGSLVPRMSELFVTVKRELDGIAPRWDHGYRTATRRFVNDAGVSSRLILGRARKQHRLTWPNLTGDDRQVLLDLEAQTSSFLHPFFFLPPDDAYPLQHVEIDSASNWRQSFSAPLAKGIADTVSLPMIEAVA